MTGIISKEDGCMKQAHTTPRDQMGRFYSHRRFRRERRVRRGGMKKERKMRRGEKKKIKM